MIIAKGQIYTIEAFEILFLIFYGFLNGKKSVDGIIMYKLFNNPPLILIIAAFCCRCCTEKYMQIMLSSAEKR